MIMTTSQMDDATVTRPDDDPTGGVNTSDTDSDTKGIFWL